MEGSKVHCPLLWTGLSNRDGGNLYPCCRFEYAPSQENTFSSTTSTLDLINNPIFKDCRSQVLRGEKVTSCFKCYEDEAAQGTSDRTVALKENPNFYASDLSTAENIQSLEIFIGRVCNLKCHTCNPTSSSKWSEDYRKLGWTWDLASHETNLEARIREFPNLKILKIIGGEPALSKKTSEILSFVNNKETVSVEISTNCTVPLAAEVTESFSHFKNVEISLSIDGFGEMNELIRYPSKWSEIEGTVQFYKELAENTPSVELVLHVTVSALNVFSVVELRQWWHEVFEKSLCRRHIRFATLHSPSYMNVNVLSEEEKKRALANLSCDTKGFASVMKAISALSSSGKLLDQLQEYCKKLDEVRGTNSQFLLKHIY